MEEFDVLSMAKFTVYKTIDDEEEKPIGVFTHYDKAELLYDSIVEKIILNTDHHYRVRLYDYEKEINTKSFDSAYDI